MIPCLTLTENRKELDAQHLVCSYLVRASRQAMYELALDERSDPGVRHRAIEVLKVVHQDWIEAQKAIAREIGNASTHSLTDAASTTVVDSSSRSWAETR